MQNDFTPPLNIKSLNAHYDSKRELALSWAAGTALTAAIGIVLLGGALMTTMNGLTRFATNPNAFKSTFQSILEGKAAKSDKLQPTIQTIPTIEVLQTPVSVIVNNTEKIQTKPFSLIRLPLTLDSNANVSKIPVFNPIKLFTDANKKTSASANKSTEEKPEINEEVSITYYKLASYTGQFSDESFIEKKRLQTNLIYAPNSVYEWNNTFSNSLLSNQLYNNAESSLAVTKTQANVTVMQKSQDTDMKYLAAGWSSHILKNDETIERILSENDMSYFEIDMAYDALSLLIDPSTLKSGDRVALQTSKSFTEDQPELVRLEILRDEKLLAAIAKTEENTFIPVDQKISAADTQTNQSAEGRRGELSLYQSLYATALNHKLPQDIINNIILSASFDFDLQKKVRRGSFMEIFVDGNLHEETTKISTGDLLHFRIMTEEKEKNYFRFINDNKISFFDENGRSAKKFLLRKPIASGTFRSGFGMRRHPILKYARMHTGVDWSAPRGTPILAAGDGVITYAGWKGGYGRHIEIKHRNGYASNYSHMTNFASGMSVGQRVSLGQVIGYVGTTGLSTGNHLHYEVKVNGRHVDPMRIRIPDGISLAGQDLERFKANVSRIKRTMQTKPSKSTIVSSNTRNENVEIRQ